MIGEVLGNYRVLQKIGEGGMGAVYLAEHQLIGRQAALKVLLREMSHRQDLVTRFFNEARAATAVKHPGIVEIYDFGYHHDGSAYIVMEFLEGESLQMRLRRAGTLPEARAAALCRQVAGALGAAHGKGIVHRDLKPDNIFIVRDPDIAEGERTKILDFGIAKLATTELPAGATPMTRTGMVMGTPAYMSPEQCKGAGAVDARADLYALGCILFEMVCGRAPFVAEGAGEVMAQHIYAPVPQPSSLKPVTPALEQVLLRALAKEPAHRFQSADEMIHALQIAVPSGTFPRAGSTDATVMGGVGAPTMPTPAHYTPAPVHVSAPTTLNAATGATSTANVAAVKRRGWIIPMVAVAVVAGGAIAIVAGTRGSKGAAAGSGSGSASGSASASGSGSGSAPAPKPEPPPAPKPEPPPTPPAAPAKITIKLSSDPLGADVYRMPQGVRVGTTPLALPMDAMSGEVVLIVKKRGYVDQQLAVAADHDSDQTIALAKIAAAKPPRPPKPNGSGTSAGSGSGSDGSLDPFDKLKGGHR
ncbi:MAG TPA: serine/threonine-protein kinase [Kofleriaceae bacterium]|nr:serine/threonine-protein kinase [Kofleriaceae bacterium]